ncbi:hypothetical protein ABT026_04605 [Streptomyces sp. NPDC002734]|uniref:hypothetical protein n=1 Tax=Streptomyces sp. NPDC002734 TaxID=3154426 RepID=UPI00332C2BC3
MDLSSIGVVAPLFTGAAALIVGVVTRWTQQGVARDRIKWEAKFEAVKLNVARFATALDNLIQAADAANRYIVRSDDIDITDFGAREPYVFAILDPLGRARIELAALPDFEGIDKVRDVIEALGELIAVHESGKAMRRKWDPKGVDEAITLLSKARSQHVVTALDSLTDVPRARMPGPSRGRQRVRNDNQR